MVTVVVGMMMVVVGGFLAASLLPLALFGGGLGALYRDVVAFGCERPGRNL